MTIAIPFPVPSKGYALNSRLRVNLDAIVSELNRLDSGDSVWSYAVYNWDTGSPFDYNTTITITPYQRLGYDFGIFAKGNSPSAFHVRHGNVDETINADLQLGLTYRTQAFTHPSTGESFAYTIYSPAYDPGTYPLGAFVFNYPTTFSSNVTVTGNLTVGGAQNYSGRVSFEEDVLMWKNLYLRGSLFSQGGDLYDLSTLSWLSRDGQKSLSVKTPTGTTAVSVSAAGEMTNALQPAFCVYNSGGVGAVTGDGTLYTCVWDTERFDQGADFGSSTFTAPVTGKYALTFVVTYGDLDSDVHNLIRSNIVTSNATYTSQSDARGMAYATASTYLQTVTAVCDMDANDTATCQMYTAGSSKTVDLTGGLYTFFTGCLLA